MSEPKHEQLGLEFDWQPGEQWFVEIGLEERLAEMTLRAMRTPSKTARIGYLAAAQFFALASQRR